MKKITFSLFILCCFAFSWQGMAQVNISEDFDSGTPTGWTDSYGNTSSAACSGNSERDNLWSSSTTGNLTTPNLVGASNATDLNISFDYKILDYSFSTPTDATPEGWGTAELQYSTDDGVNWTTILTIDDANHVVSTDCATMTATVPAASLPTGSDVKLQIANTWVSGDYYFYVDNFVAQQDLGCTQAVVSSSTVVENCGDSTFTIDVVVSDLGDATTITDGTTPQPIAASMTFGPYASGTDVTLDVVHSVAACDYTLGTYTYICPPANDSCAGVIDLGTQTSPLTASTVGANNNFVVDCLTNTSAPDVVYSILVPNGSTLDIGQTSNAYDSKHRLAYGGSCPGDTLIACTDDPDTETLSWTNTTGSDQTVYWVQSAYSTGSGEYTLAWSVYSCTPPAATYTVVNDCDVSGGFLIDVDVTDMGSATSLTVSDDQGSTPEPVTGTGVVQFGPYANATDVVITVGHDQDGLCDIMSGTLTQEACPPANDECSGAIELTVEGEIADLPSATQIPGTIAEATDSGIAAPTGTANDDVWYSFTATATDINIDVTDDFDGVIQLFSGDCNNLTSIEYDDYDSTYGNPRISRTDFVVGQTYYVRVYYYYSGTPTSSDFTIALWSTSEVLSVGDVEENSQFTYFPNPVNDKLTLNAQSNIQNVAVYNMLGQEVINASPNTLDAEVDMVNLNSGAYFVKVTIDNATKTIRVIKN
ncbi:T9SS type A sorting domain-containing protein [Gaetbulibacter sp. NE]|uniref:T9SS type A sorting domain-containing protein n=1 Tax=Gaetbulibacter sp. NE TaxID=2982307 RepID=UPI0021D00589|nr:T9SS type A sorting domain-containing protein [Gaetbulibacter sp. NE]